jgi:hypothetical protein
MSDHGYPNLDHPDDGMAYSEQELAQPQRDADNAPIGYLRALLAGRNLDTLERLLATIDQMRAENERLREALRGAREEIRQLRRQQLRSDQGEA